MNTTEAADIAKVTRATIRRWCRTGAIAATKTDGQWVIDAASLDAKLGRVRPVVYSIDTMTAIGGHRWTKAGHDRVYLNDAVEHFGGLSLGRYNTGNICSATWQGEHVSNTEGGRLLGAVDTVWFDVADNKLHGRFGYSQPRSCSQQDVFDAIIAGVRAAIAALPAA